MPVIQITDGRSALWQWDTGVKIRILGCCSVQQCHFPTAAGLIARDAVDNVCAVPDAALQTAGTLKVYAYSRSEDGGVTMNEFSLPVCARPKPADYIDPPDEYDNLDALAQRVAEKIGSIDGGIVVETDPTVPDWAKQPNPPKYTAQDVGALPVDSIKASASGAVVSVTDAAARPVVGLVSQIVAVQEGEGDPSPDNVRPIVGWDKVSVTRTGRNLSSVNDITFVQSATVALDCPIPPGTYYVAAKVHTTDTDHQLSLMAFYGNGTLVSNLARTRDKWEYNKVTFSSTVTDISFYAAQSYSAGKGDEATYTDVMISPLPNAEYEPYQGQALTADLPETVYGGTLDWVTGVLTVTHDANGAELAQPYTIQLTPQQLDMLKGANTVWSDTGNTDLVYVADLQMYIDSRIAAIAAAVVGQ